MISIYCKILCLLMAILLCVNCCVINQDITIATLYPFQADVKWILLTILFTVSVTMISINNYYI